MKRFIAIVLTLSYPLFGYSQSCDVKSELEAIEDLYIEGSYNEALAITKHLKTCDSVRNEALKDVYVWQYKLYRNIFKKSSSHRAMLKADSLNKILGDNETLDFKMLVAESYAFVRKDEEYHQLIAPLEQQVLNASFSDSINKARYYHAQFLVTDKGGNTHKAVENLQNAFKYLNKEQRYYRAEMLKNLGNMTRVLGDFDKSFAYYQQEYDELSQWLKPDHLNIATCNYHLGTIHYEKLEYQDALDRFLEAHKVWSKVYEPDYRYMRYLNEAIGDMYWELDDKPNALKYFDMATAGEKLIDNDISKSDIKKGDSLSNMGNYNSAIQYYNNAYQWRERTFGKNHVVTGACQNFVARAIGSSGNIEDALKSYQDAIDILVIEMEGSSLYDNPSTEMTIQSHHYLFESLSAKADLLKSLFKKTNNQKDLLAAFDTYKSAIAVLEDVKNGQMSEASRLFWTNKVSDIVEKSIALALQLHENTNDDTYLEEAFTFSEKNKSLLLLAALQNETEISFANVPNEVTKKEQELLNTINLLKGKIANEENRCAALRQKMLDLWREDLAAKQNDYDILLNTIKVDYPEYFSLKHNIEPVSIADIREVVLDDNTLLISYFSGSTDTYVFSISKKHINVRSIPNVADLNTELKRFFNLINTKDSFINDPELAFNTYSHLGHNLYKMLVEEEVSSSDDLSRLIIIPDGMLSYIPFEALLTNTNDEQSRNYKSLPYLIKSKSISYSPSASIKWITETSKNSNFHYVGFAPDYKNQIYNESRKTLANLVHTKQEITNAQGLFGGKSFIGVEASEARIKSISDTSGILHLAMHGDVEDQQPLLSKLYLNASETDDGILHTYEIYNLNIPAQLVILSACNTATGKLLKGEGILSLERAFQYSGSQSLLSTLWTVDDEASSKLTQSFLQGLKAGKPKDIALQEAKISFLSTANPEQLTPYYWSSFKLTGNTKALSKPSKFRYVLYGVGIILLIFLIIRYLRVQTIVAA
ncbi:CHAT domain-containing protein [Winogradskyella sp. 3972H.M.0a.05]|uniref:CHAT domain-containing protein n=1 Tax=Winogradskyella sp. 3972H.M.0a.05 TaxID=2950277 RepID=UPI00339101BA